jgi:hypothetical protein
MVQNDEQVYMQLTNIKHEKNERVDFYYDRLLKLANNLQYMTTYNFLTTIFKSKLQSYLV